MSAIDNAYIRASSVALGVSPDIDNSDVPGSNSLSSTSHKERHLSRGDLVSDIILGFTDGLTVPFALTAGLSSVGSLNLVILGGLAELFAGAISMGLGAFLAVVNERKQFVVQEARVFQGADMLPQAEEEGIYELMATYGLNRECVRPLVAGLKANRHMWVKFMMDLELKLERPKASRAWSSALSMGLSYFFGGLFPMIPYFATHDINHALFISIGVSVMVLIIFGYVKAVVIGCTNYDAMLSSLQTLVVGVLAAGTSYGIVRGFNEIRPVHV